MASNFVFGCFTFFFVFHAKSATTRNHRRELSDISVESPFSRDSNDHKIALSQKNSQCREKFFVIFDLSSNFE